MEKNKRNSDNLLKNFFKCKLENVQHFKNRNNPEFKNSCSQRFFKIRFPKNFTQKLHIKIHIKTRVLEPLSNKDAFSLLIY